MDWNNADAGEVSSNPRVRPHLAGSSNVAQKIYAARAALLEADKITAVII
jgi:hypothetical protein